MAYMNDFYRYRRAREVLGKNFISPEELIQARGVKTPQKKMDELVRLLPDEEVFFNIKYNNGVLMLVHETLSYAEIRNLNSSLFVYKDNKEEKGSLVDNGSFTSEEINAIYHGHKTSVGWLAVKKQPVTRSFKCSKDAHEALLPLNMRIPNIAEIAWAATTYQQTRGEFLFPSNEVVRSGSVVSERGCSACFKSVFSGFQVSLYDDSEEAGSLGLAAAWKLGED